MKKQQGWSIFLKRASWEKPFLEKEFRALHVKTYRVVYKVEGDIVHLLTDSHPARLIENHPAVGDENS